MIVKAYGGHAVKKSVEQSLNLVGRAGVDYLLAQVVAK